MQQAATTVSDKNSKRPWALLCRRDFGLTPQQVGCLAAIVAHYATEHCSISREQLNAIAEDPGYELDPDGGPRALESMGLIESFGSKRALRFMPTVLGVRRLAQ